MPEAHLLVPALLAIKFWIAMLETRLNVPALWAINCYMAILETRLNMPALFAINFSIAMLKTRLDVPALLAINVWMVMLETRLRNPKYCWTCGRQLVRYAYKRTSIVGHQSLDGNVGNGCKRPNTVDQHPTDGKLSDTHLNVPALLVIDLRMAKKGLSTQHSCSTIYGWQCWKRV